MSADIFHDHLDVCAQCREHPFDLCAAGAVLLQQAATGLTPTGRVQSKPEFQNFPIGTELGKDLKKAARAAMPGEVFMRMNYASLEQRIIAEFGDDKLTFGFVCAECGCETNPSMDKPCHACGSVRVVALNFVEQHFGPNWRDAFK